MSEEHKTAEAAELEQAVAAVGGPTEGAEIEIGADDLKNAGVDAPEPVEQVDGGSKAADAPPPEKKTKDRAERRIAALSTRADAAEGRVETLQEENERLKRQMAEIVPKWQNADRAALTHYKNDATKAVEIATRDLADADKDGDSDKKAKATAALAAASATLANVQQFEASQPKPAPKPVKAADPAPTQDQRQPPPHPTTQAWLGENPWFKPGDPEFNADMHDEAALFGRKLERQMRAEGRAAEIGTPEYFAQINQHVRGEFPDYDWGDEGDAPAPKKDVPQMQRARPTVASVPRGGTGAGNTGASTTKVTLSADERRLAHNLASSGAITGPKGERLTPAQAEKQFAIQKIATKRSA